ncbi:MAG: ABC transporter ATP-binding protein [Campylobacteraceae bacterium]|nr:ABC transporter ATP-binding protein [Campylobacteraceae bacterium]
MVLKISNLTTKIGKRELLKDINLSFESGELNALVGPNGAGKSTILRSISNLATEISGSVELDGENLLRLSRAEMAKKLAFMTQFYQNINLTVSDVFSLSRRVLSDGSLTKIDHEKIAEMAELLNLNSWLDISLANLSGGERQKVLIAAALLGEPKILLLDEPISHLDPKNQHEMLELIRRVTKEQNIITIIVLHDIHHALHYADKVVMLKNGEILGAKPSREISRDDLHALFDMELSIHEISGHKFVYFGHKHL